MAMSSLCGISVLGFPIVYASLSFLVHKQLHQISTTPEPPSWTLEIPFTSFDGTNSTNPTSEGGSTNATMRSGIHGEAAYLIDDAIKPYWFTFERVMMTLDGVEGTGWHSSYRKQEVFSDKEICSFDARTLAQVMALVRKDGEILDDHKDPIVDRLVEIANLRSEFLQ